MNWYNIDNMFDAQLKQYDACSSNWSVIAKQMFLIANSRNDLVEYPVSVDSFDYSSFGYYGRRMIFFAKCFMDSAIQILEDPSVATLCGSAEEGKVWFNLPDNEIFYYFDAFLVAVSTFTERSFYSCSRFSDAYRSILTDDTDGYSFESRIAVLRNRAVHIDGKILHPNGGFLVETKSNGLAVFDGSSLEIQHSLIDVKDNPDLYSEWKKDRGRTFLQNAVNSQISLNNSSHDLLGLFLSVSEDAVSFFKKTNTMIANDKGLNSENAGSWIYDGDDSAISYDDIF